MSAVATSNTAVLGEIPHRKKWTRTEYHLLSNADCRSELIEGDIVEKMGQKEPHPSLVMQWIFALAAIFGQAYVRAQAPIVLKDDTEPEPDIIVTAKPSAHYRDARTTPPAADIRLVIEISLTTLLYDAGQKARLYAASGIPEYWVSDVTARRLIVHRDPTADGYANVVTLTEDDNIVALSAPASSFRVGDYLP